MGSLRALSQREPARVDDLERVSARVNEGHEVSTFSRGFPHGGPQAQESLDAAP